MNDLERDVLQIIGENTDSPDVFHDTPEGMAQIRDSINDAIEEIAMITGSVQRQYPLLLRSDQTFYRMDFRRHQFGWITDAWLISIKRRLEQTDLIKVSAQNPRWLWNTGNPLAYGQIGLDTLFVWPCPAADLVVDLTCVVIPMRYAEDYDRVLLRAMYHSAAVNFAVSEYYASRGDATQATYRYKLYLGEMGLAGLYPRSFEYRPQYRTEKSAVS